MSVLVTGATGNVGSLVVERLAAAGVDVHALTRSPETATFAPGVTAFKGELVDVDSLRAAMDGVEAVFLLSPVVLDELNGTLSALNLIREAKIKSVAYLSVFGVEEAADVPHYASKFAAERVIAKYNMPVTILRPNAFMQSSAVKESLDYGVFPYPIGQKGISFTDVRDIAELAVLEIQRRLAAPEALGPEIYEVIAEDVLTGETVAELWSEALGRPIAYVGDDIDQWTESLSAYAPNWMTYDFKFMMKHFQEKGPVGSAADLKRLRERLGRSPRSYRDYALETAKQWSAASN
jgi:uncharacterized protein YbjT (DUF2867 family)